MIRTRSGMVGDRSTEVGRRHTLPRLAVQTTSRTREPRPLRRDLAEPSEVDGRRAAPDDRAHYRRALPDNPDFETELRGIFGRLPDEPLPALAVFPQELFEYTSPLGTYFDALPIHLLTTASLRALGRENPAAAFDPRRFRPNFLIEPASETDALVEV